MAFRACLKYEYYREELKIKISGLLTVGISIKHGDKAGYL